MIETDTQLITRYVEQCAEDAFAELVRRHLKLVFSAALRQVRSRQLAEEVTQSVFIDLARQAKGLAADTILTAWLYRVTNRTAIDVIRREVRRISRERVAVELNAMNATEASWGDIEPLLDEAMNSLQDTDRTAVLLRYFENKPLSEVGQTLSCTAEAARKRLSRAVDRLRQFLEKRGVAVGESGLAALISVNAVQAAPVGLGATITAAVVSGSAITATSVIATTKTIAMSTLQKTLITATVSAALGTGLYEAREASNARAESKMLNQKQAPLVEHIQQLTHERDELASKMAGLRDDNERLNLNALELLKLRGQVGTLRQQLADASKSQAEAVAQARRADQVTAEREQARKQRDDAQAALAAYLATDLKPEEIVAMRNRNRDLEKGHLQ